MANVNEGDRLAFVTHLVGKLCYLVRLVSRVQRSVGIVLHINYDIAQTFTVENFGRLLPVWQKVLMD